MRLSTAIALLFTAIPAAIVAWLWLAMKSAEAPLAFTEIARPWIAITGFHVDFAFAVDHLTLIMLARGDRRRLPDPSVLGWVHGA